MSVSETEHAPATGFLLPDELRQAILALARAESPRECCGLLIGDRPDDGTWRARRWLPLPNTAADPTTTFESEPRAMFAAVRGLAAGEEIVAVVHSHPRSRPVPSARDVQWRYADDVLQVIAGVEGAWAIRAWRVGPDMVIPIEIVENCPV